jgi:hypothetical protein
MPLWLKFVIVLVLGFGYIALCNRLPKEPARRRTAIVVVGACAITAVFYVLGGLPNN